MKRAYLLSAAALVAAAPAIDWTNRVTQTAEGAFVLGNPAARTRLVEYVSYTCNHCAAFANESSVPLKARFVASGGTALEVRHAVRDPIDLAATLLARCGGAARFFPSHEKLFATHEQWYGEGVRYAQSNQAALEQAPGPERVKLLAKGAGLGGVVGMSDAQVNACLSDQAAQKQVLAMANEAWRVRQIGGTPYFMINGAPLIDTFSWAALEPRLAAK